MDFKGKQNPKFFGKKAPLKGEKKKKNVFF